MLASHPRLRLDNDQELTCPFIRPASCATYFFAAQQTKRPRNRALLFRKISGRKAKCNKSSLGINRITIIIEIRFSLLRNKKRYFAPQNIYKNLALEY